MDDDDDYSEADMREFGEFRYGQGYLRRAEECAREHHQPARCLHGIAGCDGAGLCMERRRN